MLGLCCQWLDDSGKNLLPSKSLQLGRFQRDLYTDEHIQSVYITNLQTLKKYLPIIRQANIRVFRVSSSMFPLWDLVPRRLWNNDIVLSLLKDIGQFAMDNGMRLTTHPGQFVVLSSPRAEVQNKAIAELNFHGWIFDQMGLPRTNYYAINVHGGGKPDRFPYLLDGINKLDDSAFSRLTLENCEFGWSVFDLVRVYNATNVPVVFDSHHHRFNDGGLSSCDAMRLAINTWPRNTKPLTHLSNTPANVPATAAKTKLRAHSDYIRYVPVSQQEANNDGVIDVDIEAKKKNLAIFRMIKQFKIKI